jgi:hypothetical protein
MMYTKSLWIGLAFSVLVYLQGEPLWAEPIHCNNELDCPGFCVEGTCQERVTCDSDSDCTPLNSTRVSNTGVEFGCVEGICDRVECNTAEDCSTDKACINHRCEGCDNNAQCGDRGVCRDNECVCVECRNIGDCADDQKCSPNNECVPFCEEDQEFVSGFDGNRSCEACVNPVTARRCTDFPGCREVEGRFCAQGFCINRCSLEPQDFDELLDDFERIIIQPDPGGLPDCPRCTIGFDMISVRGVLERAGVTKPVHISLLDSSGKAVADFGTFSPKGQSWSTIPELMQPKLVQSVAIQGGCGYMLEISDPKSEKAGRGAICLEPRKKPLPLKRTQ